MTDKLRIAVVGAGAALTAEVLALLESHDIEVVEPEPRLEPITPPPMPRLQVVNLQDPYPYQSLGYIEPLQRTHPNSPLASRRRHR